MALLTRPANLSRNVAATITIDYAELAALPAVPAGFYKNTANWKEVFLKVKNKASGQKSVVHFTLPSTTGTLLVSDKARAGAWEIDSFVIRDFDRGEVTVAKSQIPDQATFDFNVVSGASHGDLYVAAGQTVSMPSNGFRQYGDFVIDSGGTLQLEDGGGILEIEVLSNCIINGTILGKQGKHLGGTWSKISSLGENLSFTITQKAGGNGGEGEAQFSIQPQSIISAGRLNSTTIAFGQPGATANYKVMPTEIWNAIQPGDIFTLHGNATATGGENYTFVDSTPHNYTVASKGTFSSIYYTITFLEDVTVEAQNCRADFNVNIETAAGLGGLSAFGNGGGGGRAAAFIPLNGDNAIDVHAGTGAGASNYADEYGENGPDSTATLYGAGGGFRGAHGQAIYIKATQIQGSGTIDVSGQKGGDGGAGNEYLSGGELFANGSGGGAAGGNGGKVWLRAHTGTPALTINTIGGEKGVRGLSSPGAVDAQHGQPGDNGSYDFSLF